jgi:hypothetical protein
MIAGLRAAHRWIWLLLALLLPALVVLALRARSAPPLEQISPALEPAAQPSDDRP